MDLFDLYKMCSHPERYDDVSAIRDAMYEYLSKLKKHPNLSDEQLGVWMINHATDDVKIMRQALEKIKSDVIVDILYQEKINYMCAANMLTAGAFNEAIRYILNNCFYFNKLPGQYTHYKKYGFRITKSKLLKTMELMVMMSDDEIRQHDEFYLYIDILQNQMNELYDAIKDRNITPNSPEFQYMFYFTDWEKKYFIPELEKICE